LVAKVVGTLPLRRLIVVVALVILSLLASYAIVAVWPDRAATGQPEATAPGAATVPAQ
jgi:type II secretory pathway component PulL